jgi:hypothetical protein
MAVRQYRITQVDAFDRRGKSKLRRKVRARLTRLDDGRELEISLKALGQVGDIVSLEDEHVEIALWKPHLH